MKEITLTGNDLALASFGIGHMLSFWEKQPASGYKREQVAKCKALLMKLSGIQDYAYPRTRNDEGSVLDFGSEPIMRGDELIIRKAQDALRKQGAVA